MSGPFGPRRPRGPCVASTPADAITRREIHEDWAHAGMVEAGGLVFVSYCVGSTTGTTAEQMHGALDNGARSK